MIINGIRIMTLMAAQAEFGDHMKLAGIDPTFIGVGPIEASYNTTKAIMNAIGEDKKPDIIFSVGSAGSSTLEQSKLYQISSVSYRDMNAVAFGFEKGATPFADYPITFDMPCLFSDIPKATLSTGGDIIDAQGTSGRSFKDIDADAVDMETYAIKRICDGFKIPMIGIRGISDGRELSEGYKTWEEYLHVIDKHIAEFYERLSGDSSSLVTLASSGK